MILLKYQNIKTFLQKAMFQNWSKEVFVIKKVKNTVLWTYVVSDFNGEEIVGTFYKKESQKTNQKEYIVENLINRKGNKLYVKWKGYDSSLNSCIDKKDSINGWIFSRTEFFWKESESWIRLSNYATKTDLKNATDVDTLKLAKKFDSAHLKSDVNKLDLDKLKNVPSNLSNLKSR